MNKFANIFTNSLYLYTSIEILQRETMDFVENLIDGLKNSKSIKHMRITIDVFSEQTTAPELPAPELSANMFTPELPAIMPTPQAIPEPPQDFSSSDGEYIPKKKKKTKKQVGGKMSEAELTFLEEQWEFYDGKPNNKALKDISIAMGRSHGTIRSWFRRKEKKFLQNVSQI